MSTTESIRTQLEQFRSDFAALRGQIAESVVGQQPAVETLLVAPSALAYLFWQQHAGTGAFGRLDTMSQALLLGSGIVTAVPLLLFAYAARRIRLSTLGLLQYVAPTVQFAIGVGVYHEPFSRERAVSFAFIWGGLALYTADNLWAQRRAPR